MKISFYIITTLKLQSFTDSQIFSRLNNFHYFYEIYFKIRKREHTKIRNLLAKFNYKLNEFCDCDDIQNRQIN